ncbi:MAG TPA: ABC transporter permease [Tissierellaceae bacterium]|nr:ABC transporter permease [Clostridiales bacterium]HZK01047.1 ABC transporter permease [Tissierellaceae bacterium]
MLKYIGKRLLHLIPVMLIISMVLFGIMELMPGDAVNAYLGVGSGVSVEQQAQMREELGLNKNVVVRYGNWLGRTLKGDFGKSILLRAPVRDVMGRSIWNTFILNFFGMVIAFAISIPVGIKSAVKKYGAYDNFWTVFSLVGVSMPSFFFALVLIFFVGIPLGLPLTLMRDPMQAVRGYPSLWAELVDIGRHMIMPLTVLVISSLASLTRYVRNSVLEVINQDYIRTARSKGLSEKVVIYKHAFRNALLPIVTLLGSYIPSLFGGSLILETIFKWPGIGNRLHEAIFKKDTSLVMAINVFYALLMLAGNLLADISYAFVDPRVKVS